MKMDDEKKPADTEMSKLEQNIYIIADEVLDILKQLSTDNKKQLNSELIAEKMFTKDSVREMLTKPVSGKSDDRKTFAPLKSIADGVLDKLSELLPSFMNEKFDDIKDEFDDDSILDESTLWLNSSIKIIRKYIDSLSNKNKELEIFIQQTVKHLSETEKHMIGELSAHQEKFNDDREFEKDISENMNMIKEDFNANGDLNSIRKAVLGKIENINKGIDKKREQDMLRLKKTEETLQEMGNRIADIKKEADELKKKAQEIESESFRDKLTGLFNRKAYDEKMAETLANLQRYNTPASLMICDIDHFKKINDSLGHKVGDITLRKIASLLKERLRRNDFIARYGGEEIAIILIHTTLDASIKVGENVRSFINNSLFSYKQKKIPVTISIGISSFRKDDDITTIFERADEALYLAKESGRNMVKTEDDVISHGAITN
jgi:diguanylate cyclase